MNVFFVFRPASIPSLASAAPGYPTTAGTAYLDEILQHEGEFVVIKGNRIVGYYPKRKLANA